MTTPVMGLLLILIMANWSSISAAKEPKKPPADSVTDRAALVSHANLTESSGLAASNRQPGLFWSHNDSGGEAELFAFDQSGKKTGMCRLAGAKAIDWEDMASFVLDGKPRLMVADCGDNQYQRDSISLYVLDEPDPGQATETSDLQRLVVTYPNGARNCEAIAVDPHRDRVVLIAKTSLSAGIYTIPLTGVIKSNQRRVNVQATRVGQLVLPMISAMDLYPASGDIWISNYFKAFRFPCAQRDQSIGRQLAELPEPIELPRWRQIEALAIDADNRVWVTSEGTPTPLGRLRVPQDTR